MTGAQFLLFGIIGAIVLVFMALVAWDKLMPLKQAEPEPASEAATEQPAATKIPEPPPVPLCKVPNCDRPATHPKPYSTPSLLDTLSPFRKMYSMPTRWRTEEPYVGNPECCASHADRVARVLDQVHSMLPGMNAEHKRKQDALVMQANEGVYRDLAREDSEVRESLAKKFGVIGNGDSVRLLERSN